MLDRETTMRESKNCIQQNRIMTFQDAMDKIPNTTDFLATLIFASGFTYVNVENKNDMTLFFAGNIDADFQEILTYCKDTKIVDGYYCETIKKVYAIVHAIEHDLNSILLWPFEMRQRRIEDFCNEMQIDRSFFHTVLINW
jgi:hypothetical protein